ncbi:hypothetical protein D0856_20945 [Vibrio owensii]|uniref:hypothetical protein n=1 Tax=Vibrio owensii TaxID=696485 RepID=UPI000EFAB98C|nr:hypothetical protein [Vibrio owensii]AYO22429.1 hypothetical protein D0856_20945 [Vibrio owensii]
MAAKFSYPEGLPRPLLTDMSLNQSTGLLVTEFSTGRKRARKLPNRPSEMKATWRMKTSAASLFESALDSLLLGRWFLMDIKTPFSDDLQQCEVLITQDPRDDRKPLNAKYWEYKATIQVKKVPQLDEWVFVDAILAPMTLDEFVDGADMNRYYTESWK